MPIDKERMERMRRMQKEKAEAGDRRAVMMVMQVGGPVFFTWDSTRWEA
jgi:uncharacterized membrane protein (DUF106 family)